jgi:hypothetical protein
LLKSGLSYQNAPQREAPLNIASSFCGKNGSQELSEPSFDIAGGGNELILEIHLCESFVAGASQAVAAH